MSETLGVSLTSTGSRVASRAHRVISVSTFGSWPTADPMPRSHMPCGQPKFSSIPSAPVSSTRRIRLRQSSRLSSMIETTMAWQGKRRFTSRISRRLSSSGRSVISSMLLKPTIRWPPTLMAPKRDDTLTMGSPSVFQTQPPHPWSKARDTWSPVLVGGPDASQNGFGLMMPPSETERSAMGQFPSSAARIARAAARPSATALTTSWPPLTQSPPA